MRIVQEQIFRPVISTVTFDYMDDVIRMANDTTCGLVALVFTTSSNKVHKSPGVMRSGATWPDCFDAGDMTAPHGGYAESGNDRDRSHHSLEKYSELKTAWIQLDKIARGSIE